MRLTVHTLEETLGVIELEPNTSMDTVRMHISPLVPSIRAGDMRIFLVRAQAELTAGNFAELRNGDEVLVSRARGPVVVAAPQATKAPTASDILQHTSGKQSSGAVDERARAREVCRLARRIVLYGRPLACLALRFAH